MMMRVFVSVLFVFLHLMRPFPGALLQLESFHLHLQSFLSEASHIEDKSNL